MRLPGLLLSCALLLCAGARVGEAQTAPTDSIVGTVRDARGAPVAVAAVRATGEDGRVVTGYTNAEGVFRLPASPAGGGRYALTVARVGFAPYTGIVSRTAPGGHLTAEVRLAAAAVLLDTLQVAGSRVSLRGEKRTPGQSGEVWQANLLEGLPTEPGDLAASAALEPGVVRLGGSDGEGAGLSFAGQAPSQNRTTLDGASFGGGGLPPEAVRSSGVISNTYDVARGQFSGGLISATTRSGTNVWGGALNASLDDPTLRYGAAPGAGLASRDRRVQVDGGGGGPLVRDRLFAYGAFQAVRHAAPATLLDPGDAAGLRQLGLNADSVRRFFEIARRLDLVGTADDAVTDVGSGLLRFDYAPSNRLGVTLRLDGRANEARGTGSSPLALPGTQGTRSSASGGALLQLSVSGLNWANELRVYAAGQRQRATPDRLLPAGEVRVAQGGEGGLSTLAFGGSPFLSSRSGGRVLELGDEVAIEPVGGAHSLRLGVFLQDETAWLRGADNAHGIFTFHSLRDLEAGRPASFTRSLFVQRREARARHGALFLGDTWRASDALQVMVGLRAEGSTYPVGATGDSPVDSLFGRAPARVPDEWHVSPRAGFRWAPGWGRNVSFDGGIGEFRGRVATRTLASVLSETGDPDASVQLRCPGPLAPTPDWEGYAAGRVEIPSGCLQETVVRADRLPQASVFSPGFVAPRVWRASLGTGMQLFGGRFLHLDATAVRGVAQPLARDLNLAHGTGLALAGEGGRPVFVPAEAIDPATGGIFPGVSRVHPALGPVRELGSEGRSWTGQVNAGMLGLLRGVTTFSLFYTYTRSRDLSSGIPAPGGAAATTAGDPSRREWATADFEQRHTLQASLDHRLSRWLSVGAIGSLGSGLPFTPLVQGDVNGDGYQNDRAFVFEPDAVDDPLLAAGMRTLLDDAPGHIRDCLRSQLGEVAGRNSCTTGWSPRLDLVAAIRPVGQSRRLRVYVRASNVTAGLDYLLHGGDGLRGWGQYPFADANLLQVRGFDPERNTFRYTVNPRFGEVLGGRGLLRSPMSLIIQGRLTVGADPVYQSFAKTVAAVGRTARSPERLRAELTRQVPNVPARVLALNASSPLGLTPAQVERLQVAADSLQGPVERVVEDLVEVLRTGPVSRRTVAQNAQVERLGTEAQALVVTGQRLAREILSEAQWAALPSVLSQPPRELHEGPQQVTIPTGGE